VADDAYDPDLDYQRQPLVDPSRFGWMRRNSYLADLMAVRVRPVQSSFGQSRLRFQAAMDRGLNRARAVPGMLSSYFTHLTGLEGVARVASNNVRRRQGQNIPGTVPLSRQRLAEQLAQATGKPLQTILDELNGKIIEAKAAPVASPRPATVRAPRVVARGGVATQFIGHNTFPGGDPNWASNYLYAADPRVRGVSAAAGRGTAARGTRQPAATSRTNRTGAGATRAPATSSAPNTRARPELQPAKSVVTAARPGVLTKAATGAWTRTASKAGQKAAQTMQALNPSFNFSFTTSTNLSTPARIAAQPRTITALSPRSLARNRLSTLPLVQTLTMGPPNMATGTRTRTGECECDEPKRKKSEPRCANPVISRTRTGDVQTIKRRIVCQPSRPK